MDEEEMDPREIIQRGFAHAFVAAMWIAVIGFAMFLLGPIEIECQDEPTTIQAEENLMKGEWDDK